MSLQRADGALNDSPQREFGGMRSTHLAGPPTVSNVASVERVEIRPSAMPQQLHFTSGRPTQTMSGGVTSSPLRATKSRSKSGERFVATFKPMPPNLGEGPSYAPTRTLRPPARGSPLRNERSPVKEMITQMR